MGNKDLEMQRVDSKEPDKEAPSSGAADDKPPEPPKRDYEGQDPPMVSEPKQKQKNLGFFPRPEVIYKPENSETCMTCLRNTLVLINLIIWLFGAALMGLGIWVKSDKDFWDIQTGLDMKEFTNAAYIMIATGVFIMLFAILGCYGAIAQKLWMLILFAIVVIIIILLELAVIAIVWASTNNNTMQTEMKRLTKKAMQEMAEEDKQRYFIDVLQSKLGCCGLTGPDDYEEGPIPHSCTNPDTGYPNEKGCGEVMVEYFKSKAGIFGGVAITVFLLQLAALVVTICLACSLRQAADKVF